MRAQDTADREALKAAEKRLQAISSGMYSAGDGEDATLQEQLISKLVISIFSPVDWLWVYHAHSMPN